MSLAVELSRIQQTLQENGLDGWLLYDFRGQNPVALYVAGILSSGSRRWFLWIPASGQPAFLLHAIEFSSFVDTDPALGTDKRRYVGWRELLTQLPALVGNPQRRLKIAMEYSPRGAIPYVSKLDAGMKELIEQAIDVDIVSSADLVQMVQATLSADQLAGHRRAAQHCLEVKDAAFAMVAAALRNDEPVTEYGVQQFIGEQFAARGLDHHHPALVAVNANAADPHYAPTVTRAAPIHRGDMLLIDLVTREQSGPHDCFADITWTAYCGGTVPPTAARVFQLVQRARDRAVEFIRDRQQRGQPVFGFEVDDACRAVIEEAGAGEHFIHRTGHSLGSEVHYVGANLDNLETQDRRRLIPGLLFTIEPGIYQPELNFDERATPKGLGIRSEINCIVHPDSLEVTTLPLQTEIVCLL